MSVVGVRVPGTWEVRTASKFIRKLTNVSFEFLSFKKTDGNRLTKTAFIRLSEKVDPQLVIEKLEKRVLQETGRLKAFIVDEMPDLEPYEPKHVKTGKALKKSQHTEISENKQFIKPCVTMSHRELMSELQYKYNLLCKFSQNKTDHQLLLELSKKMFGRLRIVAEESPAAAYKPFQLTGAYRRAHPHAGDFEFVLSTLHQIEDERGQPRTDLKESDLIEAVPTAQQNVDNIPYDKIVEACNKYTDKITKTVQEHIKSLNSDTDEVDPARQRVRSELGKISPYLPMMIRQVMTKHLVPENASIRRVRIYGEPFLPGQVVMRNVLRPFHPMAVQRVQTMYNLLRFNVHTKKFDELMELDNDPIGPECKMVVRSSDLKIFITPDDVMAELVKTLP